MTILDEIYEAVYNVVEVVDTFSCHVLIIALFAIGIIFTIQFKFFQIGQLKDALLLSTLKSDAEEAKKESIDTADKPKKKDLSPFQAFCLSMGARIGVGSLAGVAIALVTGGPGSIFWMWVFGFLGGAISFTETVLGQLYKEKHPNGEYHGGMVYYIRNGMKKPKFALFMVFIGILTAAFACSAVQANTAVDIIANNFNIPPVIPAIILTALVALVIFGGINRAAFISTFIVPTMAIGFIIIGLIIICMNITAVPGAFGLIFQNAFNFSAGLSGFLGYIVAIGVQRGIFITNAGLGVTPSITSSVKSRHPIEQGLVQARGVFLDMQIICTITALIILVTGDYTRFGTSSVELLQDAMSTSFLGSAAPIIVILMTVTFGFTCMLGKYSFGEESTRFLSKKKHAITIFRIIYIAIIFISCIAEFTIVWMMTDIFIAIMTLLNIFALIYLSKRVRETLKDYRRQKRQGIKRPVFNTSCLTNKSGITAWPSEPEKANNTITENSVK